MVGSPPSSRSFAALIRAALKKIVMYASTKYMISIRGSVGAAPGRISPTTNNGIRNDAATIKRCRSRDHRQEQQFLVCLEYCPGGPGQGEESC